MKIADYLFKRIKDAGVDHTFGIPGDFVMPVYAAQERCGLKTALMTHEPSIGFAADAYARIKGLGVALVTYGSGGLNMVNSVALAYAEESPLLVISGGPEVKFRSQPAQLHHCVKSFESQYKVYCEVTAAQTIVNQPYSAQESIDQVINTTKRLSRPGYIEMPRDMVNLDIEISQALPHLSEQDSPELQEAVNETINKLKAAKQPVLMAGAHIRRFDVYQQVIHLAQQLNLPVVTSILGKASFPESHPNFIGNYFGKFGTPAVREYVESSDCIICLGVVLTEMETGGYSANLPPEKLIVANAQQTSVGRHNFHHVVFAKFVDRLLERTKSGDLAQTKFSVPQIPPEKFNEDPKEKNLTVASIISDLNAFLDEHYSVVADVGDCLYAGLSIKTDMFIAPGYYSSMGFGVPASIGVQIAAPQRRPIVLVGDGGFQMTGSELTTAARLGLNPIVVVFNNASYAMLRFIDQKRDYYDLSRWDYSAFAKSIGCRGAKATTKVEFSQALASAKLSDSPFLIDAVIAEDDISPTLKRLTDHFGQKVRTAIS